MEILFQFRRRTSGRLLAYNSSSGVNPFVFQRNRGKTVVKKGWHTEPNLSQSDGRTKPRHYLPKSLFFFPFRRFLPAVAGKCWNPSLEPSPTLIPASKFILSENTVMSMKNRTKADLRQRDLSTGVTVAHRSFFRLLWRQFLYIERRDKRKTRRLQGDQCNNAVWYTLTMLQSSFRDEKSAGYIGG